MTLTRTISSETSWPRNSIKDILMAQRPMIIIGAGIAGLAAGCYAQMNGYGIEAREVHEKLGGACTALFTPVGLV